MTAPLVQEYMSNKPIQLNADDSLSFVINIFERTHISGAPVVNEQGDYVGVISKTDLVASKLIKLLPRLNEVTAAEIMRPGKPITVSKELPLEQAVDMMLDKQIHRLFVVDETGKIVGVLSSFDVMRAIKRPAEAAPQPPAQTVAKAAAEAPVTVEPEKSGKEAKKPKLGDKSEKEKEIEKRIFSLISQKQEQIMQHK